MKDQVVYVRELTPIQDVIDDASPPSHLSCDWLNDSLAFGLVIFPLGIYRKMEELRHARASS